MNALGSALYSKLSGTAITSLLGGTYVYNLQAPEGQALPYIVFSTQGGGDNNESPHRVKDLVIFVRAYSGISAGQAGSIDAQIDTALHMSPLTVTGWSDLWLAREQDLETVENPQSGKPVWMAGGMYRVLLEKT